MQLPVKHHAGCLREYVSMAEGTAAMVAQGIRDFLDPITCDPSAITEAYVRNRLRTHVADWFGLNGPGRYPPPGLVAHPADLLAAWTGGARTVTHHLCRVEMHFAVRHAGPLLAQQVRDINVWGAECNNDELGDGTVTSMMAAAANVWFDTPNRSRAAEQTDTHAAVFEVPYWPL